MLVSSFLVREKMSLAERQVFDACELYIALQVFIGIHETPVRRRVWHDGRQAGEKAVVRPGDDLRAEQGDGLVVAAEEAIYSLREDALGMLVELRASFRHRPAAVDGCGGMGGVDVLGLIVMR